MCVQPPMLLLSALSRVFMSKSAVSGACADEMISSGAQALPQTRLTHKTHSYNCWLNSVMCNSLTKLWYTSHAAHNHTKVSEDVYIPQHIGFHVNQWITLWTVCWQQASFCTQTCSTIFVYSTLPTYGCWSTLDSHHLARCSSFPRLW